MDKPTTLTEEKTYTLDELVGPPGKWTHCGPPPRVPAGTPFTSYCGLVFKASGLPVNMEDMKRMCPDCKRGINEMFGTNF